MIYWKIKSLPTYLPLHPNLVTPSPLFFRYLSCKHGQDKAKEYLPKFQEAVNDLREMAEILINKRLICWEALKKGQCMPKKYLCVKNKNKFNRYILRFESKRRKEGTYLGTYSFYRKIWELPTVLIFYINPQNIFAFIGTYLPNLV